MAKRSKYKISKYKIDKYGHLKALKKVANLAI